MGFTTDSKFSIRLFEKFARPVLRLFGAKEVISSEKQESPLAKSLDCDAAIDAIIKNDAGLFGVASRTHGGGKFFETFTMRRSRPTGGETEYAKILRAMKTGSMCPKYHVETYADEEEKSAVVAVTLTRDFMESIQNNPSRWRKNHDGETFFFAPFCEFANLKKYRVDTDGRITLL